MDITNNYKFVIIDDDIIYLLNDIKEIPLHFNKKIYDILSRTRDEDSCNMYSIENSSKYKKSKYLILKNDMSYFNIYDSIRKAGRDLNIDFSSLAKQLKNSNYRCVGNGYRGRKKKDNNETIIFDGFSIFKIKDFDFGFYYPRLEMDDIIIEDVI